MWNPNISFRPSCSSSSLNVPWYHKRKLKDDIPADLPPPKMLITEEKMVSQLKGIHLSNDYTSHEGTSTSTLIEDDGSILVRLKEKQSLPTLFVCDEIRALQKNVEPVVPKHIMDKFQRPNNALVLWQPPVGDIGRYLKAFTQENSDDGNERPAEATAAADVEMNEDNNNNSSSQDALGFFIRTV